MLKLKNNVNLKELEKFDFVYEENEYYKNPYYFSNCGCCVKIWEKTRQLEIQMLSNFRNESDILFDLITAGLIEKVEGTNAKD